MIVYVNATHPNASKPFEFLGPIDVIAEEISSTLKDESITPKKLEEWAKAEYAVDYMGFNFIIFIIKGGNNDSGRTPSPSEGSQGNI